MHLRLLALLCGFLALTAPAHARRVALVIGQNAYPGGGAATVGLKPLDNSINDARAVAALLERNGFEVISCDEKSKGCLDLDRRGFVAALDRLERAAKGADMALAYFAGHGMASPEGNMLTPLDSRIDCQTGALTNGVPIERILQATSSARHKLVILDACRNNPLGAVCPGLKNKKLSFTRIEAGALQGLLLVTSTQFGAQALDGPKGSNSPFASALVSALTANPNVYFEQVMNAVARATYEAAQGNAGFVQIPGKVVGGEAPDDCLAGKNCVGDARMALLAQENEQLGKDAAGVRAIIEREEAARGKPYTIEERARRVTELEKTLASISGSSDPLRQEARRLIDAGNVTGGEKKLDEALDADERAIAEAEKVAADKRRAAARSARDLAVLARGSDVVKAVSYYKRATGLDPGDAETWRNYADAAVDAGRLDEAKAAFAQAALKAREAKDAFNEYWATLGQGDVAVAQGDLPRARRIYDEAGVIAAANAKADPGNAGWQRDLSVSYNKVGDVLVQQGALPQALDSFKASLAIRDRLAKADPGNAGWQRDLSVSYDRVGDVLVQQGALPQALDSFKASLAIADRLAKADPGNAGWQRDLSVSYDRVGDVLVQQGALPQALDSFKASLAIRDRLAKADPGNAGWQRDLSVSYDRVGDVLVQQGALPQALDSFKASLAIADRLAKADPGNAGWQRDLSVSYAKIGDVQVAQGDLYGALLSFNGTRDILDRLAKADPGNAGWQRDLSVSYDRVGDVLVQQGALPQALDSFKASLAIADRLAKADPGNAGWQRDLAISHGRVAKVASQQGERERALGDFKRGRDIVAVLKARSPDNATLPKDLAWFDAQIGALEKQR